MLDNYKELHNSDAIAMLTCALASRRVEGHELAFADPVLAFGMALSCCGNAEVGIHHYNIITPVAEAGRLIASMHEHADRVGLTYALQSAVDQGRAWARGAPR